MSASPRVERMLMHANLHAISCRGLRERARPNAPDDQTDEHELHMAVSIPSAPSPLRSVPECRYFMLVADVFPAPPSPFPPRVPRSPAGIKAYLYCCSAYGVTATFCCCYRGVGVLTRRRYEGKNLGSANTAAHSHQVIKRVRGRRGWSPPAITGERIINNPFTGSIRSSSVGSDSFCFLSV